LQIAIVTCSALGVHSSFEIIIRASAA